MTKFIGFVIGAAEIGIGIATGNVALIVMGAGTILAQAAADLTAPKQQARAASEMGIKLGEQPRVLFLGERETAGSLVDAWDYGGKYDDDWEVLVIRLADHPCEGLTGFYVNDDWNPYTGDGLVSRYDDQFEIYFRSDTSTQPLPSIVTSTGPGWTSADIGASGCDVIVAYKADKENDKHPGWPNGRPRFLFILKGKRCYDPRKDSTVPGGSGPHRWNDLSTWEFTENAVICRYNFVRGIFADDDASDPSKLLIGRGLTAEEAPPENIFAAANLCDVGAAGIKPFQQPTTTITGLMGLSFGGSYCAHWDYAGGQIEWWDVRTRSRIGASASPGTMTGLLSSVSVARSGTAYCLAPKLPSGDLFYIVTEPLRSPVSTLVIGAVSAQVDVIRALDTIDGLRVYGAYHAAAGYLVGAGHAGMAGSARDFCVDDALHPWMASQPTGTSSNFTLTDLKTGAATTFTGAVSRSGPSDLRVAYCAAGGNFLVNTDGHFYIIDKATMTVTSTGVPAFGYDRPDTQQVTDRASFWDGMSEYSLKTGALLRALNPSDWVATIDSGFTFDAINYAIWSQESGSQLTIRFLDRSGPWRVAGPIYADQEFLEVEQMFADACAGNIVTREGSVELEPAQAKSISFSFTDADLVVGEEATWNNGILSDADGERVNTVVPSYIEPDQKWNEHAAPVLRDPADIIADGRSLEVAVPLRLVRYLAQALRIGEILRRKGRVWGRGSAVLGPRFCEVEEGDWGEWQSDRFFGGGTKTVQVDAYSLDEKYRNRLTLRETNASIFADDAVYPLDSSIPTMTAPPPEIGAPAGGTWTLNSTSLTSAGASVPALTVSGASDDQYAQAVKVEYWKSDGVTDPTLDPDSIPWTTVGSFAPDATEMPLPTPTGGETYYAAVSYIVSGQQGDRLVLGPVTAGAAAALITVEDEGSPLTTSPLSINFTGAGVTATAVGDAVTVDVPGGTGGLWWFSPPAVAGFSLVSGDATNPTFTADADLGSVLKFNSASVTGDIMRAALEPITTPAAAWSYEARMAGNLFGTNFGGAGLVVRNVANDRNLILAVTNDGTIIIQRRAMAAFGSNASTIKSFDFAGHAVFANTFWKVTYDLTNVIFWSSADGKAWRRLFTEPVATYLTAAPDKIGFGFYSAVAGLTDDFELSVPRRTKSW